MHGKLVDWKGLYRRESIDGTPSIVGGGSEDPCCVWDLPVEYASENANQHLAKKTTGQKEAADKA